MKTVSKILQNITAALLLAGVLIAFAAVVARYVLNNSIVWAEESIRYGFIWMFFLAMPITTMRGEHIALDLLPTHLHGAAKKYLAIVVEAICLVFNVAIVRYGIPYSLGNMKQKSAALHVPYGWINMAIPVGGALMALYSIWRIYGLATNKINLEAAAEEKEANE